jgi:xanthine/uracil permease
MGLSVLQLVQFVKFVSNFFNQEFNHGIACTTISAIRVNSCLNFKRELIQTIPCKINPTSPPNISP